VRGCRLCAKALCEGLAVGSKAHSQFAVQGVPCDACRTQRLVAKRSDLVITCVCGWDVTSYVLVGIYQRFFLRNLDIPGRGGGAIKTEAEDSSDTSLTTLQSTRRQVSENCILDTALRSTYFTDRC